MALVLKVKWVDLADHPDPYQRLRHIGGNSRKFEWKHSHAQAIQSIEEELFCYYVEKDARVFKLEVGRTPNGTKFLKTQADGDQSQLLLSCIERSQLGSAANPTTGRSATRQRA